MNLKGKKKSKVTINYLYVNISIIMEFYAVSTIFSLLYIYIYFVYVIIINKYSKISTWYHIQKKCLVHQKIDMEIIEKLFLPFQIHSMCL